MEIKLVRINSTLEAVGLLQIACEPNIDSDLGIRMWGGKDSTGEVSRWLAKNKPALVFSMRVSNLVGAGTRPAKVDAQGNIVAGSLSASDIPEHNEMSGLQGGSSTERFHVTLFEKENLHPPLVLSETDGKPLALNGQELSFLFGSSLKVVNNELEVDPSNISHSALANLGADDHTQYILANGLRAFTAPVAGATPTQNAHLVTKQYVDSITGSKYLQEGKAVFPATVVDLFEVNGSASTVLFEISSAQNAPMIFGVFQQSTNHQGRIVLLTVKGEAPTFTTGYYQGKIQLRAVFATTTFNMYLRASCFDGIEIAQNIVTFAEIPIAPVVVNLSSSSSDTYTVKTNSSDATPDFLEAKLEGGFGVLVEAIEEEGDDWHLKLSSKFVAGSNVVFEELPNGLIQISATGTPPSDLRVFRLQNFGANCGEGSAPTYGNPANCLTLNGNGNVSGGDKSTVNNNAYANGALSPIRISKPATKMISLSFFGVKGRTNGDSVISPSFFKLQLWEVQIDNANHVLVGTYTIQVSSTYQANVQNNSGGTNSIVEGRLVGLNVELDVAKLYGVTVAPVAGWNADNSQISRIDRLIVNMEIE